MTDTLPENAATGRTVTDIVPKTSDPNFRKVVVGGRTVGVLRAIDLESLGIRAGMRWTPRLQQAVLDLSQLEQTRKAALRLLGRRALACRQLIDRLIRGGHTAAHAQQIARELTTDGWLDDARLAETLLRQMQLKRPIGHALALQKLQSHGIDTEVAGTVLRDAMGKVNPVDEAVALARRTMQSAPARVGRGAGRSAAARRVAGALARRGFDEETILVALDRLDLGCDDSEDSNPAHKEATS